MKYTGIICSATLAFFCLTLPAEAASLYIDPGSGNLFRGDAVTVSVRLMPDQIAGECINVVDAVIQYSENIQPVDVSIGKSIFNVWVETPTINKENQTISFAGGIPNGYCGRVPGDPNFTNIIAEIVFRSPGLQIGAVAAGNTAMINFTEETQAYLNDGQGTKAPLTFYGSTLTLDANAGANGITDTWREAVRNDMIPPEKFSIDLEKDTVAFSGKYFIVFGTTDKQTGISHYEVMEEPLSELGRFTWGGTNEPWIRAASPFVLKDQSLSSTIRVKAFDKAGNEYIATLIPDTSLQTISKAELMFYGLVGGISVLVIVLVALLILFVRRRKKAKQVETINIVSE